MPNKNHRNKRDSVCEAGQSSIPSTQKCLYPQGSTGGVPTTVPCITPDAQVGQCIILTNKNINDPNSYKFGTLKDSVCCYKN